MKVFFPQGHVRHSPGWYLADGTVRPSAESPARAAAIGRKLIETPGMVLQRPLEVDPMTAVRAVHDAGYLKYLQTIHAAWHKEFGCNVLPDTFSRREGVRRPTKPAAQAGYYCFDLAAPITEGTWAAAVDSARAAVSAAMTVLGGERTAYALCRPPGHHAGRDYCGGFCYLNNVAIAAEQMLMGGKKRVAILDVDYHHGNGTQDIFYTRSDVLYVSIHADPNTQYPYFWGMKRRRGRERGRALR